MPIAMPMRDQRHRKNGPSSSSIFGGLIVGCALLVTAGFVSFVSAYTDAISMDRPADTEGSINSRANSMSAQCIFTKSPAACRDAVEQIRVEEIRQQSLEKAAEDESE
jgi:hypothetical protein